MAFSCILAGTPNVDFRLTQKIGARVNVYGPGGHNGIDIAPRTKGQTGVRVRVPHEGYVTHGWDKEGYGNFVFITSDPFGPQRKRKVTLLGHFEKFLVPNGVFISALEDVGIMGSSGFSSGIHTHWTYFVTDERGNKLNTNNGRHGALDIAGFIIVDKGRKLSEFEVAKLSRAEQFTECCEKPSPIDLLTSLPIPS